MRRPIVLVPACQRQLGSHAWHMAQDKYLHAVLRGAGCMPLLLPALGADADLEAALRIADGVMLTGSASNVDARLYGEEILHPDLPQDPARDATTLPMIRAALASQLPLLAICRGFQEVNVALGGTVWTSDPERGEQVAMRSDTGTVWVNQHMVVPFEIPFGGVKQSGIGREQGVAGLHEFTQPKIVNVALR